MNMISFKASCIDNSISVKNCKLNRRHDDKQVSLVKLSNNQTDRDCLSDVSMLWNTANTESIWLDSEPDKTNIMVYALTEQEDHYENLQPPKILGLIEVEDKSNYYKINYLQTRPDCVYSKKERPFKKIGTSLIKSVIKMTGDKNIYVYSIQKAIDFYKKFGFKVIADDIKEPLMVLRKSINIM